MTSADSAETHPTPDPAAAEEMFKYGITGVRIGYFRCGDFRYTQLEDAVAQAKRERPSKESSPAISLEESEEIAAYGITRVPVDFFCYGEFRYTNLEDAISEAKRQQYTG